MPNPGPKCTGHSSQTGKPCTQSPMRGQTVCATHGGKSPNGLAAGRRRIAEEQARKAVATYGLPVDGIDPHDALLEEIARTAGHVRWLAGVVQALPEADLVWGRTGTEAKRTTGFQAGDTVTQSHGAAPSEWVVLYQHERSHLVNVCKAAIASGLAERQVRLAEQQGALIAQVFHAFIGDSELGLTAEQQAVARRVASRHLRVLSAEDAA